MHKKIFNAVQTLNILFQALYSLALPIGIAALVSYLLTSNGLAPSWIWAILIVLGTLIGLVSMIRFIISATDNLERLERENEKTRAEAEEKELRKVRLVEDIKKMKNEGDKDE